ncbi:hypothetical protein AMTRI_Chr10g4510 [Amborella trichopoda]
MFVMPKIVSLICICLHSALHSSGFFFVKLPEAYAVFNPRCYAGHTFVLFSLSLCLV